MLLHTLATDLTTKNYEKKIMWSEKNKNTK